MKVVCFEQVCYERGLFWMVCYEWSVMNVSVLNGNQSVLNWMGTIWSMVMFLWVTSFKLFTVIGFRAKAPSCWRWWWQLHVLQQFWPQK